MDAVATRMETDVLLIFMIGGQSQVCGMKLQLT